MKWYYDQNCQVAPEYRVRDKAWLSLQNYSHEEIRPQVGWSFHHYQGHLPSCYQTLPLNMGEEHPVVSISSVRPYIPDEIVECLQPLQPGPITVDDQEEYEVEEILDSRFRRAKLWYL